MYLKLFYMSSSHPKTYKETGFTFDEIQRIESSTIQADAGILIPESAVWDSIRKKSKAYV